MKKRLWCGILILGLALTALFTGCQWRKLLDFSNQVGIRCRASGLSTEQIEEYAKKEPGLEITAWEMQKEQNICYPKLERQTSGTVITLYGNMARVLPFSMKHGGFTFVGDTSGCIISSGLARKLFGAENVVGNQIFYEEKEWSVRGVVEEEEPVLALYQTDKQRRMPYVELWSQNEPLTAKLEQIEGGLGLFDVAYTFAGSFYCSIVRLMLSIPVWVAFFFLYRSFFGWLRRQDKKMEKWCSIVEKILLIVGIAVGVRCSISFTADFVPVQWSDFEFWQQKWQEVLQNIQAGRATVIAWERLVWMQMGKMAAGVLGAVIEVVALKNLISAEK